MKKINFLLVATMLVALAIPAKQANAGMIIGLQGGYVRQNLHSASVKAGSAAPVTTKRSQWAVKDLNDIQGGYGELNFDKTFGLGKMLYVGAGAYFQYAGVKNITSTKVIKQDPTHSIAVGPEVVVGFNVIPLLDITLRGGIGYAGSFSSIVKYHGINWRILPGITIKFGKIGVFVEGGYVGNWLQHSETVVSVTTRTAKTWHGAQIGAGVKFYL